jgi:hypothetical protein
MSHSLLVILMHAIIVVMVPGIIIICLKYLYDSAGWGSLLRIHDVLEPAIAILPAEDSAPFPVTPAVTPRTSSGTGYLLYNLPDKYHLRVPGCS